MTRKERLAYSLLGVFLGSLAALPMNVLMFGWYGGLLAFAVGFCGMAILASCIFCMIHWLVTRR